MAVNTNVTFPGMLNLGTAEASNRDLLLQVFSGEVITQFNKRTVMKGLHMQKSISEGKSASFPILGRIGARFHKAGNDIMVDSNSDTNVEIGRIENAEELIFIDDLLIAPVFLDKLEEKLNHYDSRTPYAKELGRSLARAFDHHAIRTAIAAARTATHPLTGPTRPKGGGIILDADFKTNGSSAASTIFRIAAEMDFRDIDEEGRHIIVDPGTFNRLSQQTDLISRDFNDGNNGSLSEATLFRIANIAVHKSTALPKVDESAGAGDIVDVPGATATSHVRNQPFAAAQGYGGALAGHAAIAFHESAIGTLTAMDLMMESQYIIERQGDLMLAKMATGHGILRVEAAIEVSTSAADVNIEA